MTDSEELIDQADLLLADALAQVEEAQWPLSKRQMRLARTLSEVARALYLAASTRELAASTREQAADRDAWLGMIREGTDAIVAQAPSAPDLQPLFPGPSELWIAALLSDHDCHLLTVQKAGGAAGNPEAMVTCQTCDERIPLP